MKTKVTRREMRSVLSWMHKVERKAMFNKAVDISVQTQYCEPNDNKGTLDAWSIELRVWLNGKEDGEERMFFFNCAGYDFGAWPETKEKAVSLLTENGITL